jgi:hypothetical protein
MPPFEPLARTDALQGKEQTPMKSYAPEQVRIVRDAILQGRELMAKRQSARPLIFAYGFVRSGGIQIPGEDSDERVLAEIGVEVLRWLDRRDSTSRDRTVLREVVRAHAEADWYGASLAPEVAGFRIVLPDRPHDPDCCQAWLDANVSPLGRGIFPKHDRVVPPPCCDYWSWEAVFATHLEDSP